MALNIGEKKDVVKEISENFIFERVSKIHINNYMVAKWIYYIYIQMVPSYLKCQH